MEELAMTRGAAMLVGVSYAIGAAVTGAARLLCRNDREHSRRPWFCAVFVSQIRPSCSGAGNGRELGPRNIRR